LQRIIGQILQGFGASTGLDTFAFFARRFDQWQFVVDVIAG